MAARETAPNPSEDSYWGRVRRIASIMDVRHAFVGQGKLDEAVRVVRPGGKVLILDLRAHEEHWVREKLGDRHLGFSDDTLAALLKGAGLTDIKLGVGSRRAGDPFTVLVASGTRPRPAARSRTTTRETK